MASPSTGITTDFTANFYVLMTAASEKQQGEVQRVTALMLGALEKAPDSKLKRTLEKSLTQIKKGIDLIAPATPVFPQLPLLTKMLSDVETFVSQSNSEGEAKAKVDATADKPADKPKPAAGSAAAAAASSSAAAAPVAKPTSNAVKDKFLRSAERACDPGRFAATSSQSPAIVNGAVSELIPLLPQLKIDPRYEEDRALLTVHLFEVQDVFNAHTFMNLKGSLEKIIRILNGEGKPDNGSAERKEAAAASAAAGPVAKPASQVSVKDQFLDAANRFLTPDRFAAREQLPAMVNEAIAKLIQLLPQLQIDSRYEEKRSVLAGFLIQAKEVLTDDKGIGAQRGEAYLNLEKPLQEIIGILNGEKKPDNGSAERKEAAANQAVDQAARDKAAAEGAALRSENHLIRSDFIQASLDISNAYKRQEAIRTLLRLMPCLPGSPALKSRLKDNLYDLQGSPRYLESILADLEQIDDLFRKYPALAASSGAAAPAAAASVAKPTAPVAPKATRTALQKMIALLQIHVKAFALRNYFDKSIPKRAKMQQKIRSAHAESILEIRKKCENRLRSASFTFLIEKLQAVLNQKENEKFVVIRPMIEFKIGLSLRVETLKEEISEFKVIFASIEMGKDNTSKLDALKSLATEIDKLSPKGDNTEADEKEEASAMAAAPEEPMLSADDIPFTLLSHTLDLITIRCTQKQKDVAKIADSKDKLEQTFLLFEELLFIQSEIRKLAEETAKNFPTPQDFVSHVIGNLKALWALYLEEMDEVDALERKIGAQNALAFLTFLETGIVDKKDLSFPTDAISKKATQLEKLRFALKDYFRSAAQMDRQKEDFLLKADLITLILDIKTFLEKELGLAPSQQIPISPEDVATLGKITELKKSIQDLMRMIGYKLTKMSKDAAATKDETERKAIIAKAKQEIEAFKAQLLALKKQESKLLK